MEVPLMSTSNPGSSRACADGSFSGRTPSENDEARSSRTACSSASLSSALLSQLLGATNSKNKSNCTDSMPSKLRGDMSGIS